MSNLTLTAQGCATMKNAARAAARTIGLHNSTDLEDIAQDAMAETWLRINAGRVAPGAANAYAREVAQSRAIKRGIASSRTILHPAPHDLAPQNPDEADQDFEGHLARSLARPEIHRRLLAALEELPEGPRWVLVRLYIDERSTEEVAEERLDATLDALGQRREALTAEELKKAQRRSQSYIAQNHKRGKEQLKRLLHDLKHLIEH